MTEIAIAGKKQNAHSAVNVAPNALSTKQKLKTMVEQKTIQGAQRGNSKQGITTIKTVSETPGKNQVPLQLLQCGKGGNGQWAIIEKTNKYKPGDKTCDLCLSEKLYIMKHSKSKNNINKRFRFQKGL